VSTVDLSRPGTWTELFPHALALMDHLAAQSEHFTWTFGGGTVLMLRLNHRHSKDIDLFINDPQYLNYVNPRLSDVAENITGNYDEGAEFIKLYLEPGEIDIVVGAALTQTPFDLVLYQGREIRVETSAEIVAKKFHHRGDRATARDLYDLCAVATLEPRAIPIALPFMKRHGRAFLDGIHDGAEPLKVQFEQIATIDFTQSFEASVAQAEAVIALAL
jgi:predicted nucleotidyltransferase component of viral defense system